MYLLITGIGCVALVAFGVFYSAVRDLESDY